MSYFSQRRRRLEDERDLVRAGELRYGSNRIERLPRAQDRVHRYDVAEDRQKWLLAPRRFAAERQLGHLLRVDQRAYSPPAKQVLARPRPYEAMNILRMAAPSRVLFCLRRKVRREVLFALTRAGFSGSGPGRRNREGMWYRRTEDSQYSC